MDLSPLLTVAALSLLSLLFLLRRRRRPPPRGGALAEERLDTLLAWPPEPTRVLTRAEGIAYGTMKRALPDHLILAQVPIARFLTVPKGNSYREWMRRLGGQCVDLVVCDLTSQVLAVVVVRPDDSQVSDLLRRRFERVPRSLRAAGIPLVVWNADALPSVEEALASLAPHLPATAEGARQPQ
ncbi:MAG: DUF2726 domain-containing protein [Caldimonas sp.]